jgi:aspartate racemase
MSEQIKHIGIVAVTAEGASLLYKYICTESQKYLGKYSHPEISLHTFSFSEHHDFGDNRLQKWTSLISASIKKLERMDVDFVICPSNTPHEVYKLVTPLINVPWLNIAEEVMQEAVRKNYRRTLLLGTEFTFKSDLYPSIFNNCNVELNIPTESDKFIINRIVCEELIFGKVTIKSKEQIRRILSKYEKENDAVILGCTELPLIVTDGMSRMNILDSVKILGQASIFKAISTK